MENLKVYTLFSGSGGNCAYIKNGSTEILIDAGVCESSIEKSLNTLGTSLDNITDIFITHDHTDHTKGLEIICKKHALRVHITEKSSTVSLNETLTPHLCSSAVLHPLEYSERVGELTVSSFATPHDSVASVGYIITSPEARIGYATDIGHISENVKNNLTGVKAVILESNHDICMLNEGPYPIFLKKRILSNNGHLSNEDAAQFAAYLAENGTQHFLLAHLSGQNNMPELAFCAVLGSLGNIKKRKITLAVASPDLPTRLI